MYKTTHLFILALSFAVIGPARAEADKTPYPNMAPVEQYLSASEADEIALARSAAPTSISDDAEILTLGRHGYATAVKGKNGFVCYVARAWDQDLDNAEFWNPKLRGPMCLNPAAVRSVLPYYRQRTEWVLSGVSKTEMLNRIKAAIAAKQITAPEQGAMSFMLSKDGYLGDVAGGHWHPHVMLYLPHTDAALWGADLPASPIFSFSSDLMPLTLFFVPVHKWSDGTPDSGH
jgi:hypothetical protein